MRILVIDDEVALAETIKAGLRDEGFEVEIRNDGTSGLERALTGGFDVIVLDLLLPGMNGYKVCAALRERGISTPVLMLTAKSGEYDLADGLEMGADDYLTKPFSFVVLVARLRALTRRIQRVDTVELSCGDLRLDPLQRQCTRGTVDIKLTSREASVLEVLMRSMGKVVSKDEIRTQVWGADAGDDNVVEVYVGYLRKKVDVPFELASIETVRGLGYRLSDKG